MCILSRGWEIMWATSVGLKCGPQVMVGMEAACYFETSDLSYTLRGFWTPDLDVFGDYDCFWPVRSPGSESKVAKSGLLVWQITSLSQCMDTFVVLRGQISECVSCTRHDCCSSTLLAIVGWLRRTLSGRLCNLFTSLCCCFISKGDAQSASSPCSLRQLDITTWWIIVYG